MRPIRLLSLLFLACLPVARAAHVPQGSHATVTLLETTDLHSNILGYDYYKLQADPTLGFSRTATLIRQARRGDPNTVLFDDGDTIQGSVLADYQALVKPVACDHRLAIYRAMDAVGYAAGTIGNHEFNYGLPFLSQVTGTPMQVKGVPVEHCRGPKYPLVLSNVLSLKTGKPIYRPWLLLERTIEATGPDGKPVKARLRIGVLGFAPPPIMDWDRRHLQGRVRTLGVVEAARRYLPQLQAQHPDIVVALVHGGLDTAPYTPTMENAGWYLAGVKGIDAMLLGHQHLKFPGKRFAGMRQVDDVHGHVRGVPAVMGDFFGKALGVIRLSLHYRDGRWVSDPAQARSEVRPICRDRNHCVAPDPAIRPLVEKTHRATIAYVKTPIGRSDFRMSSYFADLGNVSALAIVNAAQRDYVKHWIAANRPDLKGIPVLSAAAAFRTGFGGPDDYTDVAPGPITIRSAADLYFYPNTLAAVRVDGAGLKAWLEKAAERFNRIDPARTTPQPLIGKALAGYNFDQIQGGIHYVIDVSKPVGQRIVRLTFHGEPVRPEQVFIVATNSYRANGGGQFPGLDGHNVVLAAPDANREVLINWIRAHQTIHRRDLPGRPWHFAALKLHGPVTVSGPADALKAAHEAGLDDLRRLRMLGEGRAQYAVDLSHP